MDTDVRSYRNELLHELADPAEAVSYLNSALKECSDEFFLLALRNVAEARGVTMYETLAETAKPHLSHLVAILDALGLTLSVGTK
jgi:DNA-binding phage protein